MQAPTPCAHTSQSQFSGMERYARAHGLQDGGEIVCVKVQKSSTPRKPDSRTRWCRSALPCHPCRVLHLPANHEHTRHVPAGRWMRVQGTSKGEHTPSYPAASLAYTLVLISVAVPKM